MAVVQSTIDSIRLSFGRLTRREQTMVAGGGAAAALIILVVIGMWVSGAITKVENRVAFKTEQLNRILALQGEYKAKQREQREAIQRFTRSKVRLVKLVEDAARAAGVEIGQLKPDEGQPNADGIVESRVDLRASNLSIDRLQDFLGRLKKAPGVIIVQRLKINKPYRKDTLTVDVTVMTYRAKS